jgi:hypothetical protein
VASAKPSPDLNPTEHLSALLQQRVSEHGRVAGMRLQELDELQECVTRE